MAKKDEKKNEKQTPQFDWEIGMVVILLFIIIVIPIAISVFDIGSPIKGYNS